MVTAELNIPPGANVTAVTPTAGLGEPTTWMRPSTCSEAEGDGGRAASLRTNAVSFVAVAVSSA